MPGYVFRRVTVGHNKLCGCYGHLAAVGVEDPVRAPWAEFRYCVEARRDSNARKAVPEHRSCGGKGV